MVSSQLVYKIKSRVNNGVERYKACLVDKGFTKKKGINYSETFNLVVIPTTIQLVLTIIVSKGWQICQIDVHNVFLNRTLREEVYMDKPSGFAYHVLFFHVCRLHKSL
jgi:galactitol-specific phosphotransferase system IIC component